MGIAHGEELLDIRISKKGNYEMEQGWTIHLSQKIGFW